MELCLGRACAILVNEVPTWLHVLSQACCRAGAPQTALDTLAKPEVGLAEPGLVTANRFNYLLTQLHQAGDADCECPGMMLAKTPPSMLTPSRLDFSGSLVAQSRRRSPPFDVAVPRRYVFLEVSETSAHLSGSMI